VDGGAVQLHLDAAERSGQSILRSGSDSDVAQAIAYGRRIRLYPLAQAADPPPTVFTDASGVVFDARIPYDRRFFASLHRMIQREPWLTRDQAMIDIVKSAGIEKGRPFEPDAATQDILDQAAADAHAWLDARTRQSSHPGSTRAASGRCRYRRR
jgi:hypothetical protein